MNVVSDCAIRPMLLDDFSMLEKLLINTPSDWTIQTIQDCIGDDYFQWVILENQYITGFVIIKNNHDCWEIMQLVVDKQYQRRGSATRLLKFVLAEAKKHGITHIQLDVRQSNTAAITLYQHGGFKKTGMRKKYYKNGEDAVLMDYIL